MLEDNIDNSMLTDVESIILSTNAAKGKRKRKGSGSRPDRFMRKKSSKTIKQDDDVNNS